MNTTTETVNSESQAPAKPVAYSPETPIQGYAFVGISRNPKQKPREEGDRRQVERYLHGLAVPGIGLGMDYNKDQRVPMARNRTMLADSLSYEWFRDLMAGAVELGELEGVGIRIEVTKLLRDNIAFVRPMVRTPEMAIREWRAHLIKKNAARPQLLNANDVDQLSHVFYTRACEIDGKLTLVRVLPKQFKALAMTRGGFFYEMTGAERLRNHVGASGTRGTLLNRDITTVMRAQQVLSFEEVDRMMKDPSGVNVEI